MSMGPKLAAGGLVIMIALLSAAFLSGVVVGVMVAVALILM